VRSAAAFILVAALWPAACRPGPIDVAGLAPPDLTTNLVAHWSFDEGSGIVLHDQSGNARDGTIAGATWTTGQFGGALRFPGNAMVTVPSFPAAAASWTLSLWVYIAAADVPPSPPPPLVPLPNLEVLASTQSVSGGWVVNAAFAPNDRHYRFGYGALGVGMTTVPSVDCTCLVTDAWTHLAMVFDVTAAAVAFYQNGVLRATGPANSPIPPGDTTLFFGRWALPNALFLTGALDDTAVYSRALVPEEIAALTRAPAPDR
jgi:hypothetical protein